MRPFTTVLLLGTLLLVPLIAVFGIPEFVPVVASLPSQADTGSNAFTPSAHAEHGRSAVGESSRFFPNDLFASIQEGQPPTQPPIQLDQISQSASVVQETPLGNWQVDASRRTPAKTERPFRRSDALDATARRSLTWREAVAHLNVLGIRDFRLQPGRQPHSFHFSCSFTPTDNPRITRRFEAEADEQLEAVAKVLAQVDTWIEQR
jgi:hypothetical protein